MPGEARTSKFLLSTATVMIGPQADLFKLNPDTHSIGLVKNVQASSEPRFIDLTQGIKNTKVYNVMTGNDVRVGMEVYEFTPKNLAYGLGLSITEQTAVELTLKTAISAGGTAVSANAASDPGLVAGDWLIIQEGQGDQVHVGQLASNATFATATATITLTADTAIPTGVNFTVGARIFRVPRINVGDKTSMPFFSAKIVGTLPEGNKPVAILIPKVRIVRGFNLAFNSESFSNMPFEMEPFELVSTDALYSLFKDKGTAALFPA